MFSPAGQPGEEEVRGEASSQPGEAAQDGEPRQAGDGAPSLGRRGRRIGLRRCPKSDQDQDGCRDNAEDEEDGRREGDAGKKR